ncbi:unnamed protein product [Rotaria socialis]|uniref:Tc1-like transposase DDE domain-containing protein n=1 Tax=Rotaria socialis TaxID=392032 RepID=A0A821WG87_9BILA|nr:unnamed protein product [Rotaria socialis]CAF4922029.1 unnamed protein product [Rotaria socialis]
MDGSDWIFQQDNAPNHRAKPSSSPDLNPIENLWGILARKVYAGGKQFRTKEQLKTTITKSWEEISIEQLRALVESMPERIFEVIKLNGAKTKYRYFFLWRLCTFFFMWPYIYAPPKWSAILMSHLCEITKNMAHST